MKGFILKTINTNIDINPDFVSPNLIEGYDTILGFMSAENPEALELIDEPIGFVEEDAQKLTELSEQYGLAIHNVTASPYMRSQGVTVDKAYSNMLLHMTLT